MSTPIETRYGADLFRRLVEEAEEGVWVIDADSLTVYLNARMAGMLGGQVDSLLGRPLWDFMDEGQRELAQGNVARRRQGISEKHEFLFRRLDGSRFWADLSTAPLLNADGSYAGCFAFVSDISWRKAAEQALSESERAYREVFERSHAVKLMLEPDSGAIVAANAAAREYYGYTADEFARLNISQINTLPPEAIAAEIKLARSEQRSYFLFRHRLKSGEVRDVEVHSNPISVGGRELLYSIIHDIGRQTEAERRMRLTRHTFEHAHIAAVWVATDGCIRDANAYACRMLQSTLAQVAGQPVWRYAPQLQEAQWQERWNQIKAAGALSFRLDIAGADGKSTPIEVHATHMALDGDEFIIAYARNIQDQVRAEGLLSLQHEVLESLAAGHALSHVMEATARGVENLLPDARCSILILDGNQLRHGASPSLAPAFMAAIEGISIGPKVGSCGSAAYFNRVVEVEDVAHDPLWQGYAQLASEHGVAACWSTPIHGSDGRVLGTFAIYYGERRLPSEFHRRVVDACTHLIGIAIEHREAEARVHSLAFYDPLTGLPNRSLFADRVELALAHAIRDNSPLAVLFVDLDRFKTINDSLGHAAGDRLLKTMATRLEQVVRESDTVCRQGGDEFVLLLNDCDALGAASVAEKLIAAAAEKVEFDGLTLNGSASVGIALFPDDGTDYDNLLKHADAAMYRAKELGRNAFCFYQPAMDKDAAERLEVEAALRLALSRQELLLHYQPQVHIADGSVYGLEALVRWRHPQWGMVSPARFIPIAEESGLIDAVGSWVLDEACRQMAEWVRIGIAPPRISVNLSARQFRHDDIPNLVAQTLARHGLAPAQLTLEITESLMMVRDEHTLAALNKLDAMGVALAVDDFGTGYSSLGYLKRYPVGELKLDQSFVRDLSEDAEDRALASAVVRIGQSLRMTVVAEGVETAEQLAFLQSEGCDVAQGYHFARPLAPVDLALWLAARPNQP
ncbi:EAL domain-containing protein [Chitinimonas viridis]|uniref:EAL domain-containing protein n=1 Tax=Chitinimonas viridis TaxID=664880 RepID=A0ABT8B9D8_9NEIS|nr:EAL domain-containing protein [Chitinimonas viridis]MDN3578763.1 EAL domain-containing protein [Chitinimonas viridis]